MLFSSYKNYNHFFLFLFLACLFFPFFSVLHPNPKTPFSLCFRLYLRIMTGWERFLVSHSTSTIRKASLHSTPVFPPRVPLCTLSHLLVTDRRPQHVGTAAEYLLVPSLLLSRPFPYLSNFSLTPSNAASPSLLYFSCMFSFIFFAFSFY